jgi:hypothetical protein
MIYFAKSRDYFENPKISLCRGLSVHGCCIVEGMENLMVTTNVVDVKIGMKHDNLNLWLCTRQKHLKKRNHLGR